MAGEQVERQELEVDVEELQLIQTAVESEPDASLEVLGEGEGIDPITIIAIVGGASFVGGTVSYILDRRKGGQVIDLREGADEREYRSKNVKYGLVVVYAADGKVTVDVHEPRGFFGQVIKDVIDALAGALGDAADSVADAVKPAVGEKGDVAVEKA